MTDCCGASDVTIFGCSGGSNVGQIANDAAKALDTLGQGRMYCLVGVGAQLPSFVEATKKAKKCVAIDGCEIACARKALEKAGITPHVHVVVTDLGIKKEHSFTYTTDDVGKVAKAVVAVIQSQNG
ncbi:MAG: putative zinc-binding protein [Bacillota bacterium]